MKQKKSLLFLGKKEDLHCQKALQFCQKHFENVEVFLGKQGDFPPNKEWENWQGDYIISYLARWIVPKKILEKAKEFAINFHPATPAYPGIGCTNFALYENAKEYGATCHFMLDKVDTGKIIKVSKFPIFENESVESLLERTYDYQLVLFYEIINQVLEGKKLLACPKEEWTRKPFTRKDLQDLMTLSSDMSKEELQKRIRATSFKNFQPILKLHDFSFKYFQ
jgi:methionyl-tRNA formyltransferase